jgi:FKBP-type peptidyl-prolyl cis-trans isomerase
MSLHKTETIGILLCVGIMSLALFLLRAQDVKNVLSGVDTDTQVAAVSNKDAEREEKLKDAFNNNGELTKMVIDDVVIGKGEEVKNGNTVSVHYIGTLQNGTEFDNSQKRGEPFTFTVGEGMVIKGWEEGLIGMKKGGQRLLVIPPSMGYGANAIGPIPPNSTLLFSIELVEIK